MTLVTPTGTVKQVDTSTVPNTVRLSILLVK